MPHMTLSVTSINRGPSVELSFTINCNKKCSCNESSEIIQICNWAEVSFKFTHCEEKDTILAHVISKSSCKMTDSLINMSITCETPKFMHKWICFDYWGNLKSLGKVSAASRCNEVLLFKFDIRVTVYKEEDSTLYVQIYEDTDFTDFRLIAANGNVAVHKVVLAANSDVFKTMLLGNWKETAEGNIELAGATQQTLQHLKDYMYLGSLPDTGLEPLLLLAKCYMIDNLKTQCIRKITESITCDNLYAILEFACENDMPELTLEILHCAPAEIVAKAYEIKTIERLSKTAGEKIPTLPK